MSEICEEIIMEFWKLTSRGLEVELEGSKRKSEMIKAVDAICENKNLISGEEKEETTEPIYDYCSYIENEFFKLSKEVQDLVAKYREETLYKDKLS